MKQLNLFDLPPEQNKKQKQIKKTSTTIKTVAKKGLGEEKKTKTNFKVEVNKNMKFKPITGRPYVHPTPSEFEGFDKKWHTSEKICQIEIPHGFANKRFKSIEAYINGRWGYWHYLQGIDKGIGDGALLRLHDALHVRKNPEMVKFYWHKIVGCHDFPLIRFKENSVTAKMLEGTLEMISVTCGRSGKNAFEFLLDWILFCLGSPLVTKLSQNKRDKKAYEKMFSYFDDRLMLLYPFDYLGKRLSELENSKSNKNGYFPTPQSLGQMMVALTHKENSLPTFDICSEPACGSGILALELSNHYFRGSFTELNSLNTKMALVNFYFYAPWFAEPIWWLPSTFNCGNTLTNEVFFKVY